MKKTFEDLCNDIHNKKVPELRRCATEADLVLQEFDIVNSVRTCTTFDDINVLIDKCMLYIAMSKTN